MNFKDTAFSRELLFAIGIEEDSKKYFIAIPVTSLMHVDYSEYYEISEGEFKAFSENMDKGVELANRCRKRLEDARLFTAPVGPRGEPW